jgi:hypothetical protein
MGKLILNENMGGAILARLKDFTDLPQHGYVAGQSVASAVSELFGDGRAVSYNDVDVFRSRTAEEEESLLVWDEEKWVGPARQKRAINTCQFTTLELGESYGRITETTVGRYKVLKTTRNGMLNEVFCEFATTNTQKFLETFDLNCVQVGVDLATKKLFWTPEFQSFTETRQLDVVTLHTPFHSLIRYFRKKEELAGVFGNDERILEMLAAAYYIEMNQEHRSIKSTGPAEYRDLRWRFGQIYREKLDAVAGQILPHFSIESEMVNDYLVTHLVPRFEPGKDLVRTKMPFLVHALPKLSRALREKHVKGAQSRLNYLAENVEEQSITRAHWLCTGEDFVKSNVTPMQMAQLDKVTNSHDISRHLASSSLTALWGKFSLVRKEVSRRGLWVYGVLETNAVQAWTEDSLTVFLDEQEHLLNRTYKKPTLHPLTLDGHVARELVSGMELVNEGQELHHCVGGYAGSVKAGRSRIISMRPSQHPDTWLTLELRRHKVGWSIEQLRGLQNRTASPLELKVAQVYLNYTNVAAIIGAPLARLAIRLVPEQVFAAGNWVSTNIVSRCDKRSSHPYSKFQGTITERLSLALARKLGVAHPPVVKVRAFSMGGSTPLRFWLKVSKQKAKAWLKGPSDEPVVSQLASCTSVMDDFEEIPF